MFMFVPSLQRAWNHVNGTEDPWWGLFSWIEKRYMHREVKPKVRCFLVCLGWRITSAETTPIGKMAAVFHSIV